MPAGDLTPQDEFKRGHALHLAGRHEAALEAFLQAHALGSLEAGRAAAVIAAGLGRPQQALEILRDLIGQDPADADLLVMSAGMLLDLGSFGQALALCDQALSLRRNHRDALINRGMALRGLGDAAGTLANDRLLAQAYIGNTTAQLNFADACLGAGRYDEARLVAERALRLDPKAIVGRLLRGVALAMLDRFSEADAEFSGAVAEDPEGCAAFQARAARLAGTTTEVLPLDPRCIFLAQWLDHLRRCDWVARPQLLRVLRRELERKHPAALAVPGIAFLSLALPLLPGEQRIVARAVARAVKARLAALAGPLAKDRPGRLRVGYLSADFRQHPVAECLWRVFPLHDRRHVEAFAYALTPDDGSALRRRIAADAEHFVDLSPLGDQEAAERIAADRIHVLVDCSGYTEFARPQLLAARLAPVQAQILGAPGPCGGDFVDYRITDAFATPPDVAQHWDEALAWLPDTLFLCDDTLEVPPPPSRAQCGLPEDGFVFCCFNNFYKIEPDVFDVWMRLLGFLPGSVLWLANGPTETKDRLRAEARQRGIDPARLLFAPRLPLAPHLARHACADLFLDTFYYNAGTTAVYALRAGLPVLTCAGATTVARMGGSVVRAAGLPELVVSTPREYETLALRLATYPGLLDGLRQRLVAGVAGSALFDMPGRVRALERAYALMWQRAERGEPPASFVVPAGDSP